MVYKLNKYELPARSSLHTPKLLTGARAPTGTTLMMAETGERTRCSLSKRENGPLITSQRGRGCREKEGGSEREGGGQRQRKGEEES